MTTSSANTKAITIFEGPDGAGKSTLAQEYAQLTRARYVHHGPYKQVGDGLGRMFVESMLPALLGYQDVVLDRCWLSEPIYADAFRGGNDRVGMARARLLDRLALRCGAVVVKCLPPWAFVKETFNGRKAEEYLDDDAQLLKVYGDYQHGLNTQLHEVEHDYTKHLNKPLSLVVMNDVKPMVDMMRSKSPCHSTRINTAGNWDAPIVVVGEDFGEHKNNDAMYQWPFGSLNGNGCSFWLARELEEAGISEQSLLWVNADELARVPEFFDWHAGKRFITLGQQAMTVVDGRADTTPVSHPQYWKRFQSGQPYPLIKVLKDELAEVFARPSVG